MVKSGITCLILYSAAFCGREGFPFPRTLALADLFHAQKSYYVLNITVTKLSLVSLPKHEIGISLRK